MKVLLVLAVVVACAVAKDKKNCFNHTAVYNGKTFGAVFTTCLGVKKDADEEVYKCALGPDNFNVASSKITPFLAAVCEPTRKDDLIKLAKDCVKDDAIDYKCLHDKYDPICGDDEPETV